MLEPVLLMVGNLLLVQNISTKDYYVRGLLCGRYGWKNCYCPVPKSIDTWRQAERVKCTVAVRGWGASGFSRLQ